MAMFKVTNWNTNEVIAEFDNLKEAKRVCRNQGHTGEMDYWKVGYFPVARVMDDGGCCYNPTFRVGRDDNFKKIPFIKRSTPNEDERLMALGRSNMQTAHNQLKNWK